MYQGTQTFKKMLKEGKIRIYKVKSQIKSFLFCFLNWRFLSKSALFNKFVLETMKPQYTVHVFLGIVLYSLRPKRFELKYIFICDGHYILSLLSPKKFSTNLVCQGTSVIAIVAENLVDIYWKDLEDGLEKPWSTLKINIFTNIQNI